MTNPVVACPSCNGTKGVSSSHTNRFHPCARCNGEGVVEAEVCLSCNGFGGNDPEAMNTWDCKRCNRTGMVPKEMNVSEKKPMTGLFCENPETPEGKYLVKRRDGTIPEWPNFVLGAADPIAEVALRAYAAQVHRIWSYDPEQAKRLGLTREFVDALERRADEFKVWREAHGTGDPGMGKHRVDDPATIAEMRKGRSS